MENRMVLEGVPRIHFFEGGKRCPEDICFPSALRAILEYKGDAFFGCRHCASCVADRPVSCSYAWLVGTSGAASYLSWNPGWDEGNSALDHMAEDRMEPFRRALASAGFSCEWIARREGRDNEAEFRRGIEEGIRRGFPVLGFGVVGPPEPSIIAGWDQGGDVLVGWSFFQKMPDYAEGVRLEPSGYFRKPGWFKSTERLAVLKPLEAKPKPAEAAHSALPWLLSVARTPTVSGRHNGLAAYGAWAEHIGRDGDFPPNDEATLRKRHAAHDGAVGFLAEARWYGAQFLIQVAADPCHLDFRLSEDLLHAAACWAAEHRLMWDVWNATGGNGNPEAFRRLADRETRRTVASLVLEARDQDARAADHIEKALARGR